MATIQRLDTSIPSNIGSGGTNSGSSHRTINSKLDKSSSFRDGHESRVLVVGSSGGGGKPQGTGPSGGGGSYGDLQPLSTVLSLDLLPVVDSKSSRQSDLLRAINAATGGGSDDPALGNLPPKPFEAFGAEDLRRVKQSLLDNVKSARYLGSWS